MPSGLLRGHRHASAVEVARARAPAPKRIGDGLEDQNHCSPALAENSVRKSETDTFK